MREDQKAFITAVSITFSGNMLDWDRTNGCFEPDFDYWSAFITRTKAAGLIAEQLAFPGIRPLALATLTTQRATLDALLQPYLLHNFVLKPLLKYDDLFDPTNPPRNMYEQVADEFEELGLTRRQADLVLTSLKYDVRDAQRERLGGGLSCGSLERTSRRRRI